uniref:Toll-like receptor 13 n=1 Tax=Magallana gigas TaxID=29159 RepID=K1PIR8_MAGGI
MIPLNIYETTVYSILDWVTPEPCTFSPHTDGCGNHGWMWQCGHRNLSVIPNAAIKQYRVHVDYVILRMRSRWKGVIHVANSDDFPFDAFVTYTEEDYPACIPFYQALTSLGFKISIPDKDFLPGISEAEQLLKCMDQSRKVVIIVTENFLENGWNSYAVQMVVTHAFHNQRERSIIVIIKDDIPIERLPRDLKYIWWTIVSIRWPDGNENMDLFWEEIAAALRTN